MNSRVELAQALQGGDDGTRAAMTWVHVCVCVYERGKGEVTYGLVGVCMHGCVGRVCGHRGDLRDSQPVQLS